MHWSLSFLHLLLGYTGRTRFCCSLPLCPRCVLEPSVPSIEKHFALRHNKNNGNDDERTTRLDKHTSIVALPWAYGHRLAFHAAFHRCLRNLFLISKRLQRDAIQIKHTTAVVSPLCWLLFPSSSKRPDKRSVRKSESLTKDCFVPLLLLSTRRSAFVTPAATTTSAILP